MVVFFTFFTFLSFSNHAISKYATDNVDVMALRNRCIELRLDIPIFDGHDTVPPALQQSKKYLIRPDYEIQGEALLCLFYKTFGNEIADLASIDTGSIVLQGNLPPRPDKHQPPTHTPFDSSIDSSDSE